jgi:hypothetical protein
MLTHVESASQARAWEQQLCSPQVSHAVSVADGWHVPPPPLLLPLPLPLPEPHCTSQLFVAQAVRFVNAVSAVAHVQPSDVQSSSHVTHAWSLLHAVAWVQHCWARHVAQVEVAVMAGHEPPPPLELELEQLPEVDPPPIPPPIPPPLDEPQLLLPPLDDEHPMIASAATTAHVLTKAMT